MITGRFIRTVINGREVFLNTEPFDDLLSKANLDSLLALGGVGKQVFTDDLAITYTVTTPNCETGGRMFMTTDAVISKFDPAELISFLKPEELSMLLERVSSKLNLVARMQKAQNNGDALCNPLPEVQL